MFWFWTFWTVTKNRNSKLRPAVLVRCINDLVVFFAGFYEDVLWCDKATGYKAPEPVHYMNDVIVALFLVHGCHDLVDLGMNGGVVALPPVQEHVFLCGRCIEVVRAAHGHDAVVSQYDFLSDAVQMEGGNDRLDVAVFPSIVIPEEPYGQGYTQVVVEEAGKEGICLVRAEALLTGPMCVVLGQPEEVILVQVYRCGTLT